MESLNFEELDNLEKTPFKIIGIVEQLLMGGLNHNPRKIYTDEMVYEIVEQEMENGNIVDMLGDLMGELEKSSFFKNLQKEPKKKKVK